MARPEKPLILVADDDVHFLRLIEHHIGKWSYRARGITDKAQLLREIDRERPDLILLDVRFGEHDGVEILRQLVARDPTIRVLMLTAFGSIESAIAAIKIGAVDYLSKPVDFARLRSVVNHVLDQAGDSLTTPTIAAPRHESPVPQLPSRPILGESRQTRQLRERIAAVAPTDATVLILGESGTGKELVARAIHELSPRHAGPFIPLNVAAMPRELVESTLFGHEKGAFTGAEQARMGCCEAADHGTLLLDEIGEMEISLQAKLLRFLQERSFQRVGQTKPISVDVRIVAATHRDPREQIRKELLREDLYYRLNVVPIHVSPLRERPDDIPVLANHFLKAAATRLRRPDLSFSVEAMEILKTEDWPGNIRQLENLIERLAILTPGPIIDEEAVTNELLEVAPLSRETEEEEHSAISASNSARPPAVPDLADAHLPLIERMEKQAIEDALRNAKGKVREAARALGLGQATVYRKIKRYGIPLE